MSVFFTADWHLGDPRLEILGRPFRNANWMFSAILENYRAVVKPEDTVYMLGDVMHREAGSMIGLVQFFHGRLILIRGNHDVLPDEAYEPYFEQIIPEGEGIELDVDGLPCWLTHYPTQSREDRFNLVGHIHGTWRVQKNMLNVGVDAHHFRPVPLGQVGFYYKAVCEFYDEDVWVANLPANAAHADRGKPGRYLDSWEFR